MICKNCDIKISSKFIFAIKNNQCPACGGQLMEKESLAVYLNLSSLIEKHLNEEQNAEALAALILANFEVKQIFNEDLIKNSQGGIISKRTSEKEADSTLTEETEDIDEPIVHDGIKYEKVDKKQARKMLQKLRDEALSGAYNDMDLTDEVEMISDDGKRHEYINRMKQQEKRSIIENGSGGKQSFSRVSS